MVARRERRATVGAGPHKGDDVVLWPDENDARAWHIGVTGAGHEPWDIFVENHQQLEEWLGDPAWSFVLNPNPPQ